MSWQPYIDDHLLADLPHGGRLEHAAITGHSGDVWAQSPSFPELSLEEAAAILEGFDDQAKLAQQGLYVGGVKYIVIAGEEGAVIRGQKGRDGKFRMLFLHHGGLQVRPLCIPYTIHQTKNVYNKMEPCQIVRGLPRFSKKTPLS